MLIECTSCHTQYNVDSSFPKDGRKVKCVRCDNIWIAKTLPEPNIGQNQEVSGQEHAAEQSVTEEDTESGFINTPEDLEIPRPDVKAISPDIDDFEEIEFEDSDLEAFTEDELQEQESEDATIEDGITESEINENLMGATDDPDDEPGKTETSQIDEFENQNVISEADEGSEVQRTETYAEDETADSVRFPTGKDPEPAIDFPFSATRPTSDHQPKPDRGFPAGTVFSWILFLGLISTLAYGAYTYRVAIVRELPKSADFYRMAGINVDVRELEFGQIQYEWSSSAGNPIVTIRGVVRNLTNQDKEIPNFVFAFHDDQNKEIVSWTRSIEIDSILAKEEQEFSVALPVPQKNIKFVQVRISNSN